MTSAYRILMILLVSLVSAAAYNRFWSPRPISWKTPPRPSEARATTGSATAPAGLTVQDVKQAIASGQVQIVDARTREEYAEGHIPQAINLPVVEYTQNFGLAAQESLRPDDDIIVYCKSANCDESKDLADRLIENSFTNVRNFAGGMDAWVAAGESVEKP